jgi:hypothetical protein
MVESSVLAVVVQQVGLAAFADAAAFFIFRDAS